jgi:hypothetical protein
MLGPGGYFFGRGHPSSHEGSGTVYLIVYLATLGPRLQGLLPVPRRAPAQIEV